MAEQGRMGSLRESRQGGWARPVQPSAGASLNDQVVPGGRDRGRMALIVWRRGRELLGQQHAGQEEQKADVNAHDADRTARSRTLPLASPKGHRLM